MALDRCIRNEGTRDNSVYDERGLVVFWACRYIAYRNTRL